MEKPPTRSNRTPRYPKTDEAAEAAEAEVTERSAEEETSETVCARCGRTTVAPALAWTYAVEDSHSRWFCPRCVREHLRAIEGRLDSDSW